MYAYLNARIRDLYENYCPIVPQPKNKTNMKILKTGTITPPGNYSNAPSASAGSWPKTMTNTWIPATATT